MRFFASVALAATLAASTLSGCLPVFGCGAFNGSGDTVLARGNDSLMLCANGGFSLTLADGTHTEGRYTNDGTTDTGTLEGTATVVFTLTEASDIAPELGEQPWTVLSLDQTALDHADVQCSDLETRGWWTPSAAQ